MPSIGREGVRINIGVLSWRFSIKGLDITLESAEQFAIKILDKIIVYIVVYIGVEDAKAVSIGVLQGTAPITRSNKEGVLQRELLDKY